MAHEVYSFKTDSDEFSVKCISSLLQEGMDLHLKDLQWLEEKVKEQKVFDAQLNKTAALPDQEKPKKKLPPLFSTSREDNTIDLIEF